MSDALKIQFTSQEATSAFAQKLAAHLRVGDVILLTGDIGAGKTHFARSLIGALLTAPEDVPSPTFTLVQIYDTKSFEIWHADLYRLTSPDEVVELGLTEAFSDAVCLVEWPDRLADLAPEGALSMRIEQGPDVTSRDVELTWTDPRWGEILGAVCAD